MAKVKDHPNLIKVNQAVMTSDAEALRRAKQVQKVNKDRESRIEKLEEKVTSMGTTLEAILTILQEKSNEGTS